MIKILIIPLLLLVLPTLQQGDGEFTQTSSSLKQLQISPSSIDSIPNDVASKFKKGLKSSVQVSYNWDFLKNPNNLIKSQPNWITASDFQILPKGATYYFKSCFCSFCPQQGIRLNISSTSWIVVYINGNWVSSGPPHWNDFVTITIPAEYINCGCKNTIEIYGINFQFPSPIGISYAFYQICRKSLSCKDFGITFYNFDTCECQCVSNCNQPFVSAYPDCACHCPKYQVCHWPKYFNRRTCSCECVPRACCTPWIYQDSNTCQCDWRYNNPLENKDIKGAIPLH